MKYYAIIITIFFSLGIYSNYQLEKEYKESVELLVEVDQTYQQALDICAQDLNNLEKKYNNSIQEMLRNISYIDIVDVTMYNPVPEQTNSEPLITASGANIVFNQASQHKWIAVSWDLHRRYGGPLDFGDAVYIQGTEFYDGVYIVQDLMNERWMKRIDILQSVGSPIFKYTNVSLYKFDNSKTLDFTVL